MNTTERGRKRRRAAVWRLVVQSYPCHACGAAPGRTCLTEGGRPKYEPHTDRSRHAASRGWAFAEAPARCVTCNGPLPGADPVPGRCEKCLRRELVEHPPPTTATKDNPGPDGSYDVPLFGAEE